MLWTTRKQTLKTIGAYDVLDRIATGGVGSVYKGRHRTTGQVVAIKVLADNLASKRSVLQRFQQEFLTARRLDHPNMIKALDHGQDGTVHFLVMEYVEGENLYDRIEARGKLAEDEALAIVLPVAQALQRAHDQGIIHRDVKPDNILLSADGQIKLADLGLAKDLLNDLDLTRDRSGLGTPNFMAPEQFQDAKNVDVRCDVYSLGATLYMAVTGKIPFNARGVVTVLKKKLSNDIVPPRKLAPRLGEQTERVILRAIQADAKLRPASCLEFISELTPSAPERTVSASARPAAGAAPRMESGKTAKGERRVAVRHASELDGTCQAVGGIKQFSWLARARNISATGISLVINRRFEPGTVLRIELEPDPQESPRTLIARVVRVKARSAGKWEIGCALVTPLTDDDAQTLR